MYDAEIGRWHVIDYHSEVYYALTPYNYAGNTPVNAIDLDGNLFIFANGFMPGQYEEGQKYNYINRHNIKDHDNSPNPYTPYAPDRGFYQDGPRNNVKTFENDYWEGVDK